MGKGVKSGEALNEHHRQRQKQGLLTGQGVEGLGGVEVVAQGVEGVDACLDVELGHVLEEGAVQGRLLQGAQHHAQQPLHVLLLGLQGQGRRQRDGLLLLFIEGL